MTEVVEDKTSVHSKGVANDVGSKNKFKKWREGSWISPFRTSGNRKNQYKELREQNSIDKIHVPKKFTSHPTLDSAKKEQESKKKEKASAAKKSDKETGKKSTEDDKSKEDAKAEFAAAAAVGGGKEEETEETGKETEQKEEKDDDAAAEGDDKEASNGEDSKVDEEANANTDDGLNADSGVDGEQAEAKADETDEIDADQEDVVSDDGIVEKVKENPIEIVTQPDAKYEPVQLPNQEVLDSLKDKPLLLNRYKELNTVAVGSVSRKLDDPDKIIDMGLGMKMTQRQLLEIAAKRVAPVISNINEEVAKTRDEDEILRQKEVANKVAGHEKKLQAELEKYAKKVGKQKDKFDAEIAKKLEDIEQQIKGAKLEASNFDESTRKEIANAHEEYKSREEQAVTKHENDKVTLVQNHEELEATKKQELESAKENQTKTAQEIEDLKKKKEEFERENEQLTSKIEELEAKVNEKKPVLEDLKAKHGDKQALIEGHKTKKSGLEEKLATAKKDLKEKEKHHSVLGAEVAAISATLGAYASKLTEIHSAHKEHPKRLAEAKDKFQNWEKERESIANDVAKTHERKKLEAEKEAELKRLDKERKEKEAKEAELKKSQEEKEAAADPSSSKKEHANGAFLGKSNELSGKAEQGATDRKTLDPAKAKEKESDKEKSHKSAVLGGAAVGGGAAAAAAGGAGIANAGTSTAAHVTSTSNPHPPSKSVQDSDTVKSSKSGGFNKFKSLRNKINKKHSNKEVNGADINKKGAGNAEKSSVPVNAVYNNTGAANKSSTSFLSKQKKAADLHSEASTISVYEEVSDNEYEKNKSNPNYLQLTLEELEKKKFISKK
ncbi:Piso0_001985 [Millerozyma farinosa CBS 7064]|uniref:Piso0_001985 protein n=1 Tax=Pichia sorbitophila (strain ATCC MYA-4447 / BCRC 22081 / CBS 7064 / NBRC 10061 / NRRL Y-12695) TaxID=559304 RepID=G8YM82_PICSO|nr:Piso0_001985 [Millerozyma farinosa CBS 7064]